MSTLYARAIELIRSIPSRTKHGPLGSGAPGPCGPDCIKCRAEALLKQIDAPYAQPGAAITQAPFHIGCPYCEREGCDADCAFHSNTPGSSRRKTAAEWRAIGAAQTTQQLADALEVVLLCEHYRRAWAERERTWHAFLAVRAGSGSAASDPRSSAEWQAYFAADKRETAALKVLLERLRAAQPILELPEAAPSVKEY